MKQIISRKTLILTFSCINKIAKTIPGKPAPEPTSIKDIVLISKRFLEYKSFSKNIINCNLTQFIAAVEF